MCRRAISSRVGLGILLVGLLLAGTLTAQHCAPITESYLNGIQLARQAHGLGLSIEYCKTGGRQQQAYQAYLLAYAQSNAARIDQLTPQQAIELKLVAVVETRLMLRDEAGHYRAEWELQTEQLVEQLTSAGIIAPSRVKDVGGWKSYQDQVRLAVFIPFLDDEQYSDMKGLPEDRHECNYAGDAALLFETLPQSLTVCFGVVQAVQLEEGVHYLEVNGRRPARERMK